MHADLWKARALATLTVVGGMVSCGPPPLAYALRYVVSDGDPAKLEPPPTIERTSSTAWPIYVDADVPEGCGVGLFGDACERGLLEDELPLNQQEQLGPDGLVFE